MEQISSQVEAPKTPELKNLHKFDNAKDALLQQPMLTAEQFRMVFDTLYNNQDIMKKLSPNTRKQIANKLTWYKNYISNRNSNTSIQDTDNKNYKETTLKDYERKRLENNNNRRAGPNIDLFDTGIGLGDKITVTDEETNKVDTKTYREYNTTDEENLTINADLTSLINAVTTLLETPQPQDAFIDALSGAGFATTKYYDKEYTQITNTIKSKTDKWYTFSVQKVSSTQKDRTILGVKLGKKPAQATDFSVSYDATTGLFTINQDGDISRISELTTDTINVITERITTSKTTYLSETKRLSIREEDEPNLNEMMVNEGIV